MPDPSMAAAVVASGLFVAMGALGAAAWALAQPRPEPEAGALPDPIIVRKELGGGVLVKLAAPDDDATRNALRRELLQAGYTDPRALEKYLGLRSDLALLLPVVGYLALPPRTALAGLAATLLLAAIGYAGPAVVVSRQRASRLSRMRGALPNLLDMLVGCLEAGLGLDASLRRSTRELAPVAPALAQQIDLVNAELSAGVERAKALQHLVDRTGLDDIASLASVMTQAERYGTGIADAIRAHAQLLRRHRTIEAERRAAEVAPRLTVVMILFIMPALFVVLVGPAVVNVVERLLPTLTGGR